MYEIVTIEEAQEHLAELIAGLAPVRQSGKCRDASNPNPATIIISAAFQV